MALLLFFFFGSGSNFKKGEKGNFRGCSVEFPIILSTYIENFLYLYI